MWNWLWGSRVGFAHLFVSHHYCPKWQSAWLYLLHDYFQISRNFQFKRKKRPNKFLLFPFNCTNLHAYPQMSGHSVAFVKSAALTEDLLGFGVLAELKNAKVVPLRVTLRSFCGGSNTCSSCLCESCPGNRRNTLLTHWAMSHLSLVWDVAAVVLVGWTWRTPWPFFSLLRRCACMLRACFVHVSASSTFCA